MFVVYIMGGLGNQLFQYNFALFLKEESKDKPYFAARIENIKKYQ